MVNGKELKAENRVAARPKNKSTPVTGMPLNMYLPC